MIAFWNRKEVYMGYSMNECGEIRSILAANSIKFTYKVVNRYAHGRGTRGGFGERAENLAICIMFMFIKRIMNGHAES